jgi:Uma2 family endonuclease
VAMSTLLPIDTRLTARTLILDPPLTDAELEELCRANDSVQIERTREGVIQMNPPAGLFTGDGNAQIIGQLTVWWETHERGRVTDSNTGFYLPDGSMRCPDAAYISPATLTGLTLEEGTSFPHLCPDFVVELLSASDRLHDTQAKMESWIENGAKLAWLVDPYARKVHVYEPRVAPVVVSSASVRGTGPIDGFVLDLNRIWRRYEL